MKNFGERMQELKNHLTRLFQEKASTPRECQGGLEVAITLVLAEMRSIDAERREGLEAARAAV